LSGRRGLLWPSAWGWRGARWFVLASSLARLAASQQESPLSKQYEKEEAPKKETASDKEKKKGAEFKDNPEWLTAEEDAKRKAAEEQAAKERGDDKRYARYLAGYRRSGGIGLSPLLPQNSVVVPGLVTPPAGGSVPTRQFQFDFHGYLQAGLRAGIGTRDEATVGQRTTTLHGDPAVVGGAFGWFEHTNTVPVPWAQMNFEFGNDVVRATAILGAWSLTQSDEAAGYFQAPSKLGFYDAYLTYTPRTGPVGLRLNAGVFNERYGGMSEYHAGAYGVSLIAQIYGMGAAATVTLPFENDVTIITEASVKGDFNKAESDLVLDQSNEYAPVIEGSTYAAHGHLSFDFDGKAMVTGHAVYAFSQDDRGDELAGQELYLGDEEKLDGSLTILGLDARLKMQRFGHLYVGGSHVIGKNTLTVSNLVQVLNNGPGRDLVRRYFTYDSVGNGSLTLVGGQYELSLGRLLRHPTPFYGGAPDLTVALFGIFAHQENAGTLNPSSDMLKFGTEVAYLPLKHLALSMRMDAVFPNLAVGGQTFGVITPKVVFRSGWSSQATATLQYSGYVLGDAVVVNGDERLLNNPSESADAHLLALYGTIWW